MEGIAANLDQHRVAAVNLDSVCVGTWATDPNKSSSQSPVTVETQPQFLSSQQW
jgi:hypothetical protein